MMSDEDIKEYHDIEKNMRKKELIKHNKKFVYPGTVRESINGKRHYVIGESKLPSVTTILQATMSEEKRESLRRWMERVGCDLRLIKCVPLCTLLLSTVVLYIVHDSAHAPFYIADYASLDCDFLLRSPLGNHST